MVNISYEQMYVNSTGYWLGNIPGNAVSCMVVVEAAESAQNPNKCIRWLSTQDNTSASESYGIPAGHGTSFEITGLQNIQNFNASSVDGQMHIVHVIYFG